MQKSGPLYTRDSFQASILYYSCGAPVLQESGPLYTRDGDNVVIKASLHAGQPPFNISWKFNNKVELTCLCIEIWNKIK